MPRRLATVPQAAPRALGLIRVSKARDEMISPEVQRTAIEDYAATKGYQITGWMEGLDESGSRSRSAWWPRLDQAVAAVEAREYDVIVVWKFSRVSRHRLRWAVALDRVEEAGGRLESATERVDTTTSTGRFTRGMLAELQAFEAERIGETWKEAHSRRVAQGKPASGKPRFGYVNDPLEKIHKPDPETGPVLASLYRRYVAGESVYALVEWLNQAGWRTTRGGLWSQVALRRVLDSGFASGRFSHDGRWYDGVHEPLIDAALWQAYLDARVRRRAQPARTERSQYLLSGLVRCQLCGGPMNAAKAAKGRRELPRLACKRRNEQGTVACVGTTVTMELVEDVVRSWLMQVAEDVDAAAAAVSMAEVRRVVVEAEADRLARLVTQAEDALTRLELHHATRPMPESVYHRSRTELQGQFEGLARRHAEALAAGRVAPADVPALASGLLADWDVTPVAVRREVLRQLIAAVVVRGVRGPGQRPEVWARVVPAWEARSEGSR